MRLPRTFFLAACGGALLVAASPAAAATLVADQACYVESLGIGMTGTGFAAGAQVQLSGEQVALSGAAGADGAFQATVKAPLLGTVKPASKKFTITATDSDTNTVASVDVQVATAAFSTSSGFRSPGASRTWSFSGLFQRPGKPIYGHFRHNGKTYANFRFGVPKTPCGKLKRKAPGIPARNVPAGAWTIQVDFNRGYDPKAAPRLTGTTNVFTTFRRR